MSTTRTLLNELAPEARDQLLEHSRPVRFPAGTRIFHERQHADRFWIIECGRVELDMHVPGRRNAVVDTLASGSLLGCSWLFPPYHWHLGATATTEVRALEFDASAVRELCAEDLSVGEAVFACVAATMARRLLSARSRLLDDLMPRVGAESLAYAR
ncbi:cyclic nucleotide-binding domain-containing protein [Streptomyces sp. SKN60]|uniref:cyclic nucleotide-binding domain-containing protein n=1 Tax=Streptomyces sp. SKN60 TaxID=2855506 RepID=UPI002248711B|nr:cyclic nucleotide-binding domain-containing protein [Streptomyces sp. SKN60]MCX2180080.1 cyclic nucleotide-binding domain-containing protein [Streptomyces sp. SKN60]